MVGSRRRKFLSVAGCLLLRCRVSVTFVICFGLWYHLLRGTAEVFQVWQAAWTHDVVSGNAYYGERTGDGNR